MKRTTLKNVLLLLILVLLIGTALVACDREQEQDWDVQSYADSQKAVNLANSYSDNLEGSYTQILEGMALEQANQDSKFQAIKVDETALAAKNKKVIYKKRSATYGLEDLSYWGANNNITYAGSLLKINSSGVEISPIVGLKRKPLTLSIGLEGATGVDYQKRTVNTVTQSSVGQAINELVKGFNREGAQLPYMVAMELTEIKASEEINAALGLSFNVGSFFDFSSEFNFNEKADQTYALLTLKQIYFTVNVDYNAEYGAFSLLDDSVTLKQMQAACPEQYCPTYVSSVTYGRIAAITIKTSDNYKELKTKLNLGGGYGYIHGDLATQLGAISQSSNMDYNCFIYGGSAEGGQDVLKSRNINEMIENLNQPYDPIKMVGMPISYQLSHISDNSSAKIGFSGDYYYADVVDAEATPKEDKTLELSAEFSNEISIKQEYGNYSRYGAGYIADNKCLKMDVSKFDFDYVNNKGLNILLQIEISIKEKNDGYQEIYVYNEGVNAGLAQKNKEKRIADIIIEHGVGRVDTTYKTYVLHAVITADMIERNAIWIAFDASGNDEDTWYAKDITIKLSATTEKTYPMCIK